jgi:hypothetical protein
MHCYGATKKFMHSERTFINEVASLLKNESCHAPTTGNCTFTLATQIQIHILSNNFCLFCPEKT